MIWARLNFLGIPEPLWLVVWREKGGIGILGGEGSRTLAEHHPLREHEWSVDGTVLEVRVCVWEMYS